MDGHEDRTGVSSMLMRMREEGSLPRLIAFDLDYTLWSCYCEFHEPPFSLRHPAHPRGDDDGTASSSTSSSVAAPSQAFDRHGSRVDLYSEARAILHALRKEAEEGELQIAVVSRTPTPVHAKELLTTLGLHDWFHHHQIYPGSKKTHFSRIFKQTGLAYEDMLFFDDEKRNIREVGGMGVTSVLVKDGISVRSFSDGLKKHAERRKTLPSA